jgi:hypothetical protein
MIVDHDRQFVFISTPKAGTHTMFALLGELYGLQRLPGGFHRKEVPPEARHYTRFTVVRNPYVRAVSVWWHLLFRDRYRDKWRPIIGTLDFRGFLRWLVDSPEPPVNRGDVVLRPQHAWLANARPIQWLRLERLESEFAGLPFVGDEAPRHIPRRLSSGSSADVSDYGDWRSVFACGGPAYAAECARLVERWAGKDFELFGYARDWQQTQPIVQELAYAQ